MRNRQLGLSLSGLIFGSVVLIFVVLLGLKVGPPFSWFADTLRGLNLGDALFWTVAAFLVLKLGEIIAAALGPAATARDRNQENQK